jgi:hypothetical protein
MSGQETFWAGALFLVWAIRVGIQWCSFDSKTRDYGELDYAKAKSKGIKLAIFAVAIAVSAIPLFLFKDHMCELTNPTLSASVSGALLTIAILLLLQSVTSMFKSPRRVFWWCFLLFSAVGGAMIAISLIRLYC